MRRGPRTDLPDWTSVLAVVAHPDDESFGLGAVLTRFVERGAAVHVLCLTRGEASTLHGVPGDLHRLRADELAAAARELGLASTSLLAHADGHLSEIPAGHLADDVAAAVAQHSPDGLVTFDASGVTGHPDHAAATHAAVLAGQASGLPVLGWTLPGDVAAALRGEYGAPFSGHGADEVDVVVGVDRARQLRAVMCHASQAVPGSVLWRRLALLGAREHLRWQAAPMPARVPEPMSAAAPDPPVGSADQNSTHSIEGAHPWTS